MAKSLKDWSVRTKLLSAFVGVALLSGVVGLFARNRLLHIEHEVHEISALGKDGQHLAELEVLLLESLKAERTYVLTGKAEYLETYKKYMHEIGEMLRTVRGAATENNDTEDLRNLEKFEGELRDYEKTVVAMEKSVTEQTLDTATEEEIKKTDAEVEQMMAVLREIIAAHDKVMASDESDAVATVSGAINTMYGVSILSLLAGVVFGVLMTQMITRPLAQMVSMLRAIGEGDLTQRLPVSSKDEIGELANWFNVVVEKLNDILGQVQETAAQVAGAAQQLSSASEELSAGAQQQASSLEETAASLEEMSGTIKQNAENAQQANQLAVGSRDVAERGGQVVNTAVEAMTEINQSSRKIADIITVIDEIAFQTNLLALNAAVEAARAGEQGRGFAVVAAEVRNLSQRSATASKEIKSLIQDSTQRVQDGSALVTKSGQTLDEIVGSVKRVTDIVGEMAAAGREQANGIEQVNKAVTQMDQVVQENAAQTEEMSSTAQTLTEQAEQLELLVGRFKLTQNGQQQRSWQAPTQPVVKMDVAKPRAGIKGHVNGHAKWQVNGHAKGQVNGQAHGQAGGFEEF